LKISSISLKEKYFQYLPYLYHLFARGRATSKHGGGGRYNAILEFKGEQIKKYEKEKEKKNEKKKERKI
jgi:PHP family Zn ribbon phosphoesterase